MIRHAYKRGGACRLTATILVAVVAVCIVCGSEAAVAAAAEAPRWKLTTVATPTNLVAGSPRNEVQSVNVEATGGTFTLAVPSLNTVKGTPSLSYNATASEVQAALNTISGVQVSVAGGPGGSAPYVVTFEGSSGNRPVGLMHVNTSLLTGGSHTLAVAEAVPGERAPQVVLTATNVGGTSTDGSTITVGDLLPGGVTLTAVKGFDAWAGGYAIGGEGPVQLSCETPPVFSCTYGGTVDAGDQLIVVGTLSSSPSGLSGSNQASVSGGGAKNEETVNESFGEGLTPAPFGPALNSAVAALSTTQAGAHADLTTQFTMNTDEPSTATADLKDIRFDLPPGLVGSTVGMARCSMSRVIELLGNPNGCATDTIVGMATVTAIEPGQPSSSTFVAPLINIAPSPGEPAAFGFDAELLTVRLDTSVLSNGDYGVRVTSPDLPETADTFSVSITTWGVPALHNGPGNDQSFYTVFAGANTFGGENPGQTHVPLLTNPQQCTEPLTATMSADSWTEPGVFRSEQAPMGTMTGCDQVPFSSSFSFLPDTLEAGVPAGYTFDLNVPQHNEPTGNATSSLKNFKLELPKGIVVNPSAAQGLQACSSEQFYGPNHPSQDPASPAGCPREAQVGEVEVETPDLEKPLKGQVFLGTPECNPCTPADAENGKMVRLFVQLVGEGEAGVIVKLEGRADVNQQTGQITTLFNGTPQVPFNRLHFVLEGGPRAVLANPRVCGPVKATGDLTPWTTPFGADSTPFYEFEIKQNCFGPQFNPTLRAGLPNIQAGEYGPFTLSFGREDHDQFLGGLELHMPPGLVGSIAHVPLCPEPQASQGTCGPQSLIGHTQVLTGPGTNPFLVTGGQVFLTEGYKGASYGLSIVVPATAGPYTLSGTTGHGTVVVRATVEIDPYTAALTVKSDPLPTVLDGIPLQLKIVNVTIDRPEFTFGPTNCSKLQVTGTLSSAEGMSANVSSPFQVTNCARLGFGPKFNVTTSGKTSKANGASLNVKLIYPKAPWGTQANIAKVKVDLPKQLPSRLTTLQKACTAAQFNSNPAGCPAASIVGHATATTPILPVPLTGPAYFVSHGGEAFPSLIVVLQGYGVTVDLVGTTFISKKGITSSTFKSVPDVPVGTFQLTLPQGRYSALTANGNLCKSKLAMPTAFVAQNGMETHGSTKIGVTGCPKHKVQKAKHHNKKGKGKKKG
jgi:hypothetical protein